MLNKKLYIQIYNIIYLGTALLKLGKLEEAIFIY